MVVGGWRREPRRWPQEPPQRSHSGSRLPRSYEGAGEEVGGGGRRNLARGRGAEVRYRARATPRNARPGVPSEPIVSCGGQGCRVGENLEEAAAASRPRTPSPTPQL